MISSSPSRHPPKVMMEISPSRVENLDLTDRSELDNTVRSISPLVAHHSLDNTVRSTSPMVAHRSLETSGAELRDASLHELRAAELPAPSPAQKPRSELPVASLVAWMESTDPHWVASLSSAAPAPESIIPA